MPAGKPSSETGSRDVNRSVSAAAAIFLSLGFAADPSFAYQEAAKTPLAGRVALDSFPGRVCRPACFKVGPEFAQAQLKNPRHASQAKERPNLKLNQDYFLGIFSDARYIVTSPLRWNGKDWLKAGAVLGVTGGLIALDNDIQERVQDNRTAATDDLARVFEPFGNVLYSVPALAGFYAYGHFAENERAARAALLSLESFAITGLFTQVLKAATGRPRPNSGRSSTDWEGPGFDGNVSFPSNHTSTAFAIATVFADVYKDNAFVPPIAYGIAGLTAYSRLNDDEHWASDVFLGGALGYFISRTILKLHSGKRRTHYTLYPRLSGGEPGLVLNYRF